MRKLAFQEGGRRVKKILLSNPQRTTRTSLRLPERPEVTMTLPVPAGKSRSEEEINKKRKSNKQCTWPAL
jgi:hypothetical protein